MYLNPDAENKKGVSSEKKKEGKPPGLLRLVFLDSRWKGLDGNKLRYVVLFALVRSRMSFWNDFIISKEALSFSETTESSKADTTYPILNFFKS